MINSVILAWLNHQTIPPVMKIPSSSSIYRSLAKKNFDFWKHLFSWLRDDDIDIVPNYEFNFIFEKFDIVNDLILVNHIYFVLR